MICRGGTVVIGPDASASSVLLTDPLESRAERVPVAWHRIGAAFLVVFAVLAVWPGLRDIPPLIESDYCHQLISVERFDEGLGFTSLQPVAPRVPWEWHYDYRFLTQWPVGYPFLVWMIRQIFGMTTIEACRWISLAACSAAFVGWFSWMLRALPAGVRSLMIALVAATCPLSIPALVNPSTDLLVIAALPYLLLLLSDATGAREASIGESRSWNAYALSGLLGGSLFMIRYAAAFIPVAILCFLAGERVRRPRFILTRHLVGFGATAALPISIMMLINWRFGDGSMQSSLNLGHTLQWSLTWADVLTAWRQFTDVFQLGRSSRISALLSCWPILLAVLGLILPGVRREFRSFFQSPAPRLAACLVVVHLGLLLLVTGLFRDKYNYVSLSRYYWPVRPFYFLLFVAPLSGMSIPVIRVMTSLAATAGLFFLAGDAWLHDFRKSSAAGQETTRFGCKAVCFTPGAVALYDWLTANHASDWIVVSNFRENLALETGIAPLPIPPNAETLSRWVHEVARTRNIERPRVMFVLDVDNRWRSSWLPTMEAIVRDFRLRPIDDGPADASARVYDWTSSPDVLTNPFPP